MDADSVCHSPISHETIERFYPVDIDLDYLGRDGKYSECGLCSLNLGSVAIQDFLSRFQKMYDDAESGIFTLHEWHDRFVFDFVRQGANLKEYNWSQGLISGEGHPLINSEWGAFLDHLKGKRKELGRSKSKDLVVKRTEAYWK